MIFEDGICILKLTGVARQNILGEYVCEAVNAIGSASTICRLSGRFVRGWTCTRAALPLGRSIDSASSLSIIDVAPRFTRQLEATLTVHEHERVQLHANVLGCPQPSILWTRDGQPLSATDRKYAAYSVGR
jgi:hypothetical protein